MFSQYRALLGISPDAKLTPELINTSFRELSKTKHPDKGGSSEEFQKMLNAKKELLESLAVKDIISHKVSVREAETILLETLGTTDLLSFFFGVLPESVPLEEGVCVLTADTQEHGVFLKKNEAGMYCVKLEDGNVYPLKRKEFHLRLERNVTVRDTFLSSINGTEAMFLYFNERTKTAEIYSFVLKKKVRLGIWNIELPVGTVINVENAPGTYRIVGVENDSYLLNDGGRVEWRYVKFPRYIIT